MMFVIKGVSSYSENTLGELAIVSYQDSKGEHNMSFFYNKEEIFSDFVVSYSNVLSKLDKRPQEIVLADKQAYLRVAEDNFELVDLYKYTNEDKKSVKTEKHSPVEASVIRQVARVHNYDIPDLDLAVRAKSHMKQYQMRGLTLAMKLAWENPIKYDEVELYPVPSYYADFEAMTDVVYLDYTIQDYTQPVKSVTELAEEDKYYLPPGMSEDELLQDDELEDIMDHYEEEPIEDEVEWEEEVPVPMTTPVKVRPKGQSKYIPTKDKEEKKPQKNEQPRDKSGKFTSKKTK